MDWKIIQKSILAGVFISIGGVVSLTLGWPIGPFLFSFGLIFCILTETWLFTGKSGFLKGTDLWLLIPCLLLNFLGCFLVSLLYNEVNVEPIVLRRISDSLVRVFFMSCITGIIMTVSVYYARVKNNWLPLIAGIPTFIFCGLPHCIADAFYYMVWFAQHSFLDFIEIWDVWLISVIGNFVGCNFHRILSIRFGDISLDFR